jgi:hypothetical protein
VTALINPVVMDELVIRPLRPTPRGFIVLAGEDGHCGRDGDVDGIVKAEVRFLIESTRRNTRVRQPVDCVTKSARVLFVAQDPADHIRGVASSKSLRAREVVIASAGSALVTTAWRHLPCASGERGFWLG